MLYARLYALDFKHSNSLILNLHLVKDLIERHVHMDIVKTVLIKLDRRPFDVETWILVLQLPLGKNPKVDGKLNESIKNTKYFFLLSRMSVLQSLQLISK